MHLFNCSRACGCPSGEDLPGTRLRKNTKSKPTQEPDDTDPLLDAEVSFDYNDILLHPEPSHDSISGGQSSHSLLRPPELSYNQTVSTASITQSDPIYDPPPPSPDFDSLWTASHLFDDDYLYNYLRGQIERSNSYEDLFKMIESLLPLSKLKQILLNQLDTVRLSISNHSVSPTSMSNSISNSISPNPVSAANTDLLLSKQTPNQKKRNPLQEVYLQTASLVDMFSTDILAQIVRFLPSSQYPRIPCISRTFHMVMTKYPSLYHSYSIHISLDKVLMCNECILWVLINHNLQRIRIVHQCPTSAQMLRNDSISMQRRCEEDAAVSDPDAIKYELRTLSDITEKIPFLWYHCKKWYVESTKKIKTTLLSQHRTMNSGSSIPSMVSNLSIGASAASIGATPIGPVPVGATSIGAIHSYLTAVPPPKISNESSMQSMQSNVSETPSILSNRSKETPSKESTQQHLHPQHHVHTHINILNGQNGQQSQHHDEQHGQHHDNLFTSILERAVPFMESLTIDNVTDKDGAKWSFLKQLDRYRVLQHLCLRQNVHHLLIESWLHSEVQLQAIRYLELHHISRSSLALKCKPLIEGCKQLMVLDIVMIPHPHPQLLNEHSNPQEEALTIQFPNSLHFVRLQCLGQYAQIDLSHCTSLCALYLIDSSTMDRNDPFGELGALDTILSIQDTLQDSGWLDEQVVPSVDAHITWPQKAGIECLVLDNVTGSRLEEASIPIFVNDWFSLLQSQFNKIPVRCVRYLTHPALEKEEKMDIELGTNADPNPDPGPHPVLSLIVSSSPKLETPTTPTMPSTHLGARRTEDMLEDPLKGNTRGLDMVTMKQLRDRGKDSDYRVSRIQVLEGDADYQYEGCLWKELCRLKLWNESELEETLSVYRNWFDIGVGTWIRDLGSTAAARRDRRNDANMGDMRVVSPYATSMRPTRSYGFRL